MLLSANFGGSVLLYNHKRLIHSLCDTKTLLSPNAVRNKSDSSSDEPSSDIIETGATEAVFTDTKEGQQR